MGRADAVGSFKRLTMRDDVVVTNGGGFSLESGIPVVFDGVIGAAVEQASYGGPLVAELGVGHDDGLVLLLREGAMGHLRRELVAPP